MKTNKQYQVCFPSSGGFYDFGNSIGFIGNNLNWFQRLLWRMLGVKCIEIKENQNSEIL